MSSAPDRIEADYTRGGASAPVRAAVELPEPPRRWAFWVWRGPLTLPRAALVLAVLLGAAAVLLPLDGPVLAFTRRLAEDGDLEIGGDLRREIMFVQQWGDLVCTGLVLAAVWLLDRGRRVRLWDAVLAACLTAVSYQALKLLVGRPRPKYDDPWLFLGPWRSYPLLRHSEMANYYAWEFWRPIRAELWSMPSSHTAAAACLSVVLLRLYPRLTPLLAVLAVVVGLCRVVVGAHYPSDVAVGLLVGYLAASLTMDHGWGVRLALRVGIARPCAAPLASNV